VIRANKMREEILQKAQAEAEVIREKSEREIRQQIANARVELKEQIINLTLHATQRLIGEQLTEQKHRDLVGSFIDRVDSASRN
jgi:F-type H+-transporting ATPase subunit b